MLYNQILEKCVCKPWAPVAAHASAVAIVYLLVSIYELFMLFDIIYD